MKVEFWNHKFELFIGGTIIAILTIATFLIGLILPFLNYNYLPILVMGIILMILAIYIFFIDKRMLSKVVYSEEGIECKWLKKTIACFKWSEITDIKAVHHGKAPDNLSFISGDQHIDVGLSKKMYDAIMIVCPCPNIKFQIKNLEQFKYLHKND